MEYYDKMEDDVCEFKKYVKMTNDLMIDAYKWARLSDYADDDASRMKYKNISDMLYDMYLKEYDSVVEMFKGA